MCSHLLLLQFQMLQAMGPRQLSIPFTQVEQLSFRLQLQLHVAHHSTIVQTQSSLALICTALLRKFDRVCYPHHILMNVIKYRQSLVIPDSKEYRSDIQCNLAASQKGQQARQWSKGRYLQHVEQAPH